LNQVSLSSRINITMPAMHGDLGSFTECFKPAKLIVDPPDAARTDPVPAEDLAGRRW
jgi:hypothetical protein